MHVFQTFVFSLVTACAVLSLQACGGGSGDSNDGTGSVEIVEPPAPKSNAVTEFQPNVHIWNQEANSKIQEEDAEFITVRGQTAIAPGDIVITGRNVLKVLAVSSLDSNGMTKISGSTPELEEVLSFLSIDISELQLTPEMFIPAEGVEAVAQATQNRLLVDREKPLATVIRLKLSRSLGDGLEGTLEVSFTPTVTFNVNSKTLRGSGSLTGNFELSPKLSFTKGVSIKTKPRSLGHYRVQIISPLSPPGFLMLKIPIKAQFSATAGELQASIGAAGQADFGLQMTVSPEDINFFRIGDGISIVPNNQFINVDLGVSAQGKAKVSTGLSLSAMFGLTEPLVGEIGAAIQGDFTYLRAFSSGAVPFEAKCIHTDMKFIQDLSARANFFGLKQVKATEEISYDILKTYAPAECTMAEYAVNVHASWRPRRNDDVYTGGVTQLDLGSLIGGRPIEPGAVLEVQTLGSYSYTSPSQYINNGSGVFITSSGVRVSPGSGSEVGGALTPSGCNTGVDPVFEDFNIPPSVPTKVVVPPGAKSLLLGVDDCLFRDNSLGNVRIRISVLSNPPAGAAP